MTSTERTLDSSQKYSSPLNSILEIAEKIGFINEEIPSFSSKILSSIQLVNLLCELLSLRDQNEKILHELTKIKDSQSSFDLVNESELDFSKHIESIISNKQDLLMRLKDPFVGENINIEPQYHKDFAELFPLIAQSIASLSYELENIEDVQTINKGKAKI
ncbi:275_t:CDS:2 [Diversispora eburnea]|uniref:275_t:CDS:1 n=1 Tax=Diversispora eburnea TaxID=1213867 RepID=A0A9N8YVY8_9GLOM|nr:275_t:CDS:2 [Diversispora eburnea]